MRFWREDIQESNPGITQLQGLLISICVDTTNPLVMRMLMQIKAPTYIFPFLFSTQEKDDGSVTKSARTKGQENCTRKEKYIPIFFKNMLPKTSSFQAYIQFRLLNSCESNKTISFSHIIHMVPTYLFEQQKQ